MWSNVHTHSHYCDGKDSPMDYVSQALATGMVSLGFSSHAPLPFDCKWCMKPDQLDKYLIELRLIQRSITNLEVYKGLEIDFIPGIIAPSVFRGKLDFTIGSIHFVEKLDNGTRWEIDGQHTFFLEGLENIFKNNIQDAIVRYYELTREMVLTDCPSVIGHLDKIKIQNTNNKLFDETEPWYQAEILKTLEAIHDAGSIVEVNTRGLYLKKSSTTYPSPWILKIIQEKKIPVTVSSDAHHPKDVTNQFQETAKTLLSLGFQKISILKDGEWKQYKFNEHGVIFN